MSLGRHVIRRTPRRALTPARPLTAGDRGGWLVSFHSHSEMTRVTQRETAGLCPASRRGEKFRRSLAHCRASETSRHVVLTKMLRHYPLYPLIWVVVVVLVLPWAAYLLRAAFRTRHLPVCWSCGAVKVRRLTPQHFLDSINTVLLLKPYRCSGCRTRFYGFPADTGQSRAL
jgi:hypothetical protein